MIERNVVKLNVGGVSFVTKLSTLEKCNTPVFNEILAEFHKSPVNEVFIDRDGTHFSVILNYLRTNKLVCPNDKYILELILVEAQHYQIAPLIDAVKTKITSLNSSSLGNSQSSLIHEFSDRQTDEIMHSENSSNYCQGYAGSAHNVENNENTASLSSSINILNRSNSGFHEDIYTNPFETPTLSAPYYLSESQDIEESATFVQTCNISQLGPQVFDATVEDF
ncbi:BTB/POZ domain-containing protein KCTD7 [Babesia microti strain RI]|uniref:BTB/POZ domain-containing protein KCTD7 n=1 Tax=Babesia microti (strain RI) TaxID=1133968 RepID=I7IQN1_BABMR|nr:BTB/POZ domain-containing protein KCTD7 [Babesia microti strain RI]CCF73925.1 BTB/POZ domain-containing protein KCTD7 [Babesia microti strain RI]|eukprot:XP_012648534.1 BTB/POZ domain-containing protein KCTD7 [Babesia microti strain RI]